MILDDSALCLVPKSTGPYDVTRKAPILGVV